MAGKAMILMATALVLARAAQVSQAFWNPFAPYRGSELKMLCQDENVALTTRTHFKAIVSKTKNRADSSKCSDVTLAAIIQFEKVLGEPNDNICSNEKVDEFKAFYRTFMDSFLDDIYAKKKLPKSLQHFVIAYGMKVSKLCKKSMIHALNDEELMKELDGDFARILEVTDRQFSIEEFIKLAKGPANFLMSIESALISKREQIQEKIQVKDDINIHRIKMMCSCRFHPVRVQIVQPMERLAYIGFDYLDEHLGAEKVAGNLLKWSEATFLCDLFNAFEVEPNKIAPDTKAEGIEVITEVGVSGLTQEEKKRMDAITDLMILDYEPKFHATIGEVVNDRTDKNFSNKVIGFNTRARRDFSLIKKLSSEVLEDLTKKPINFFPRTA